MMRRTIGAAVWAPKPACSTTATATYCFAVNPKVFPANNMQEAIALIRKNPGKYFFASPGNGTPHHIGMELINLRLGLNTTHVPYKGFAGAMQDLVGGQVHMMFTLVHSAIPQVRGGRLKILGVTGAKRSAQFPEAPTFRLRRRLRRTRRSRELGR